MRISFEMDPLKSDSAITQSDAVLWFVFLLDPSLLEKHLNRQDADPSPPELITKFLTNGQANNETTLKTKKILALKILSLKVAAHLNWDISILLNKLSLGMQFLLLKDLLYMTRQEETDPSTDLSLNFSEASPQVLFSVVLFHRWVLCALVKQNIFINGTSNNGNSNNSRAPGVVLNGAAPAEKPHDEVMRLLEKQAPGSVAVLQSALAAQPISISVPTFDTFQPLTEDSSDAEMLWENCEQVTLDEFRCQLHFDLGMYFIYRQDSAIAREHFSACDQSLNKCPSSSIYCKVSRAKLDGLRIACGVYSPPAQSSLLCQFHASIKQQYMGIVNILVQDNKSQEIPMVHREHLELDIQGAVQSGKFTVARDLLIHVQCLNVARRLAGSLLICQDYSHRIRVSGPKGADILLSVLKPLLSEIKKFEANDDTSCRFRVKKFIQNLLEAGNQFSLTKAVQTSPEFSALFETSELDQLCGKSTDISIPAMLSCSSWDVPDLGPRRNPRLEIGALEQQLIQSYDHEEIRQLLSKLSGFPSVKSQMKAIWNVNCKWELPIPVHSVVMILPKGFIQEFCYILLAKAHELASVQEYSSALKLYAVVEDELKNTHSIPPIVKLMRLCRWEALIVEITQFLDEWPAHSARSYELAEACKACLSARQTGEALIPRMEVVERCVVMLLNVGPPSSAVGSAAVDFLTKLDRHCGHVELAAAFAYACQDIVRQKACRHVSRDAWELVLPVFLKEATKRSSSGLPVHHAHRDSPVNSGGLGISTLWAFLSQLREPTMITLALSLLARIHNVLKDDSKFDINVVNVVNDVNEVSYVNYVNLWPASISGPNSYSSRAVSELLYQLLGHALQYNPIHVGWLKVLGDLNFVMGHHSSALKAYLEAAVAATDFFSQPLPKMQIDDHVIRRMIKCCSLLQCHTQAAVLCQFLDEIDYATAFKSLGETKSGSCADAMDSYYECVWDTTLLEYLVHLHTKRGETHRKQLAIHTIGLLELNSNNNAEIQRVAENVRKARFLRALAHQYVC